MNEQQLQRFEPLAKTLVATNMAQSLSFCMERKYLQGIDGTGLTNPFHLHAMAPVSDSTVKWIAISQIGRPLENSAENCFTAIQKILYSCFLPKQVQLLFLVIGHAGKNSMYIGLRCPGQSTPPRSLVKNLCNYMKGIWPGLKAEVLKGDDTTLEYYTQNIGGEKFENVFALTGIPSMETQYKSLYPATIDKLMAGLSGGKDYAYMVVADPVEPQEAEGMLYNCREMNGQAESLKSMNVTEGLNISDSTTDTVSRSISDAISFTESESESKTRVALGKKGKIALSVAGFGLAGAIFPASAAMLEAGASAGAAALSALAGTVGLSGVVSALIPKKTVTKGTSNTKSHTETNSNSQSQGHTEGRSQSMSRNIVNKHIEAISEHLFYHSRRFETGKAIGLWKVGVYLAGEKETDLQAGALQLRSTISGQETIYEPVRIHNISSELDEEHGKRNIRSLSLGEFLPPAIFVQNSEGIPFKHPLGEQFNELRTILTTKELSYLMNFPLRSVPGISVIDSSPEFSLTPQNKTEDGVIDFGKMLYGGTPVEIPYHLTISDLSKHTLLSGINGSGKTNTVMSILDAISTRLPFLIIEPAKTEYVDWAVEYNKTHPENPITIYMPGCKTYKDKKTRRDIELAELKLNPFQPVWLDREQEPNVLSHIDRLKSTFAAAFPMYDILPVLMEDLIYSIYQNKSSDWLNAEPEFGKTMPPTLNSMSVGVDKVISNRQYEPRIEQNMKACLNTRIDSLKRGWKGRMLNTVNSTPWRELFERPVVINLSYVGDDTDKGFFMSLILQFLYEYRTACAELGRVDFNDNSCKHLTVIEEAHRVMMKCDKPDMPQYKTAMMFSNMLSEIRAYGEGMLLVDQVPTRLIPDAIKNTNTKITHRLVAEDDVKAVAEAMGLSKEQRKIIPKLMVGECLVSTALTPDKYWVKVNKSK
ncbi:MAG: ATP-binding protein [Muribaculaceae bacterium]|nr:ATP-binding protein [Muribaculaceae bacterium]